MCLRRSGIRQHQFFGLEVLGACQYLAERSQCMARGLFHPPLFWKLINFDLRLAKKHCQWPSGRFACYQFICQILPLSDWRWDTALAPARWEVSPLTSQKTCVFKPNPLSENSADIKKVSFGALFAGNYHKVPRNKVASLTWEAGLRARGDTMHVRSSLCFQCFTFKRSTGKWLWYPQILFTSRFSALRALRRFCLWNPKFTFWRTSFCQLAVVWTCLCLCRK